MSYILPYRQYEYENYHNRVIGNKYPSILLERSFPIHVVKNEREQTMKSKNHMYTPITRNPSTKKINISQRKIAEVTGVGILFNEKI